MDDVLDKFTSALSEAVLKKADEQALQALLPGNSSFSMEEKIYKRGEVLMDTATGKIVQFYGYLEGNPEFVAEIIYPSGGKNSGLFRKSNSRYLVRPFEMERFKSVGAGIAARTESTSSTSGALLVSGGISLNKRILNTPIGYPALTAQLGRGPPPANSVAVVGSIYFDQDSGNNYTWTGSKWLPIEITQETLITSGYPGNGYAPRLPFSDFMQTDTSNRFPMEEPAAKPEPAPLPTKRERKFNLED